MERRAFIMAGDPRKPWLATRTRRSLTAAGFTCVSDPADACLLVRAGEILRAPFAWVEPPFSNKPLVAVGLPTSGAWQDHHALHGGDYPYHTALPPPICEWHASAETLVARLGGRPMAPGTRVVHWPPLDLAASNDALRVWQIVTSLQHGGAERIALDLAVALPAFGIESRLVTLGRPFRTPLPAPSGTLDLAHLTRFDRAGHLARLALAHGVDVFHVHLTDAAETRVLADSGIPVIATVHNSSASWPAGWLGMGKHGPALMLACSQAVEAELREHLPEIPVRTVWNGIRPQDFPETPRPPLLPEIVIACVANPRPQKRLHLLPAILAATRAVLVSRGPSGPSVRLVIAGETSPDLEDAVACRTAVDLRAAEEGLADAITWTEGKLPVREVLAGCHVLVSCSAYEGLSLAHLEALSSGRPVIACDTGGTRELGWRNPALTLLDAEAPPADFARAIVDAVLCPPPSAHPLIWRDFSVDRMAARVARFLLVTASRPVAAPETLWFVTNNLSTGGAQSSLRRLVREFHRNGVPVRVALLQEYPEHPTAGRIDLAGQGIPIFVPPPSGLIDPADSVDLILAEMAAHPPRAVVFWNAIARHKLLLAEALPFTSVHDVSPGEMWFTSMEKCLADPPPGLPIRCPSDYGRLLTSLVVKYQREAPRMDPYGTPVTVIPNGIALPPELIENRASGETFVFGSAARISPQKRLDELLAAFRIVSARLPHAVLRIAGGVETGADEHARELRIQAEGLPVEWVGELSGLRDFHAECDIFVMISDPAGCPNASLEALAAGLPVIATDVGGASEQVIDGITGLLVAPRDPQALAETMIRLAGDGELRRRLAAEGREHVRRHFSMERMLSAYHQSFLPDQSKVGAFC